MDLNDLESVSQIEELGVKQLKVVLTRNCIDFKGCVEKQELIERVKRLWIARQKEKGICRFMYLIRGRCFILC